MNKLQLINQPVTMSSLDIAEMCEKQHKDVLYDIRNMFEQLEIGSAEFSATYIHPQNKQSYECFNLNKEMSLTLVAGYNVKLRHKIIQRWQELENKIQILQNELIHKSLRASTREESPRLNCIIEETRKELGKDTPEYIFSNEYNMLNKLVIGMTAKQFRQIHNLSPDEPIRDHMTLKQIYIMDELQKMDSVLIDIGLDYQERKDRLTIKSAKLQIKNSNANILQLN